MSTKKSERGTRTHRRLPWQILTTARDPAAVTEHMFPGVYCQLRAGLGGGAEERWRGDLAGVFLPVTSGPLHVSALLQESRSRHTLLLLAVTLWVSAQVSLPPDAEAQKRLKLLHGQGLSLPLVSLLLPLAPDPARCEGPSTETGVSVQSNIKHREQETPCLTPPEPERFLSSPEIVYPGREAGQV